MYKAIRKHNTVVEAPDDSPSILEELYDRFRAMTPKERNDVLQALYTAHLANKSSLDNVSIELFKTLIKSFQVSIQFEELEISDDTDRF